MGSENRTVAAHSLEQSGFPTHSPTSNAEPQVHVYSIRPVHEQYELPSEAPFTAEIVIDANNVTEIDIKHAFSSLPVTGIRSPPNTPGQFFIVFSDVQGLKQCLDQYWMFKIHGYPIRTYVASAPQSSVKPLNALFCSTAPDSKSHKLLPLAASNKSPSCFIQFEQLLLHSVLDQLLKSLCKSILLEWKRDEPCRINNLKQEVLTFFKKVGYVSHHFFESALLATKVFFQRNTFHLAPEDLPQIFSFASFLEADIAFIFLHIDGVFSSEEFLDYSNVISGLELKLEDHNDLEFLDKSLLSYPQLNQLEVHVHRSISMELIELLKVNTIITSVDLNRCCLEDEGARALAEALKVNTSLTSVCLIRNSIEDEGARALAEALKVNATLTSINLLGNSIEAGGARALAEALKVNSTCTNLNLQNNCIRDEGAMALANALKVNSTCANLNLQNNSIGAEGVGALAEALKVNSTLTTVNLTRNSIRDEGARALAEALKVNTTLTTVNLTRNSIRDEGARALAEALKLNSTCSNLNLQNNSIGAEGARALAEMLKVNATMTSINLEETCIEDEGARALAAMLKVNSTIVSINLNDASIGAEGASSLAEALKVNTTITNVDMGNNCLRDEGARALAEALKVNTSVTTIDLMCNSIGDKGARALAEALKLNTTVTSVDLYGNSIRSVGVRALLEELKIVNLK
ncbi:hypothetical protein GEMRC1_010268 [Eukaryota sp. GEM-RC1]